MSKCVATTNLDNADSLLRFIESIHIGGKPIELKPGTEVLFSPRNLESLTRSVDAERLNVLGVNQEVEERVTDAVMARFDSRLADFEKRIEALIRAKK
jgi:hypothetical protein